MAISVFLTGLGMGLGLIVAIGAQNAFVLRQGLRGEHVFWVCLTCALSDAILIGAGVGGMGTLVQASPWLAPAMRLGGAAFLIWYGWTSLKSALTATGAMEVTGTPQTNSLKKTLATCMAFTWLNPHVYLDTVVLLGSVSTQFETREWVFGAGGMAGSFLFFFSLGYGARWLRPLFAKPAAWRVLEGVIAFVMWAIAAKLLIGG